MNYRRFLLILFLACNMHASAQKTQTDTVEQARKLSYAKSYDKAVRMLSQFELSHPKDINSVRLQGQILSWENDYDNAFALYAAALQRNPNPYVTLDYGRMLFEQYHLQKAKEILLALLKTDPQNVEALNTLGTIAYWQGHTRLALKYFKLVTAQYPKNSWAVKYVDQMRDDGTPYLAINESYLSDSQPLKTISSNIETGWYSSFLFSPKIDVSAQDFNINGNSKQLYAYKAGNTFSFNSLNLKATATVGGYRTPVDNSTSWTAGLALDEKITSDIDLNAFGAHVPYFNSLASLQQKVTYDTYGANLTYNPADSWYGWIGFNRQRYMDNNNIQTAGISVLSPPLQVTDFSFYIGYSFNYSNADNDEYQPNITIAQAESGTKISGVYSPYFTPKNQLENSVLANVSYKPDSAFTISINSNIGAYTIADKPYFYLDYNTSQQLEFVKGFYRAGFVPVQATAALSYTLSGSVSLQGNYTYIRTFFYNSSLANLGIKIKI